MKLLRKILILIMFACITLGVSISVEASEVSEELYATEATTASGTCGENLTWTLENGTLTISGTGAMINYEKEEDIPWYSYSKSISNITINSGITSIGGHAFYETNVKSIILPNTVTDIRGYAFAECDSLIKVEMTDSVKTMGGHVFEGCDSLLEVKLSNNLSLINGNTFTGCTKLCIVNIPTSCTKIGYESFLNCDRLVEVDLSTTQVEYIDHYAFAECDNLLIVKFPKTLRNILHHSFENCVNIKKIIFDGITPYMMTDGKGNGSFRGCTFTAYYPQSQVSEFSWTKYDFEADYGGEITWIGYESTLTTPSKPYKIANVVSGVHVYWNAVSGATKYGLWRSETGANGSYKWMGNPTTNHFTDTKVESGKTYYYCVSTCNPKTNAHSIISEPLGITYVSTPDITNRMNLAAGVKLTWNKISGATGYAIYHKPYTGNVAWTRVETISGNETFTWTDKSVASANGTLYRYTIRALAGTNMKTLSGCRNTGRTMARLTSRTMNSVTKTAATSVKCTWSTTAQASGYEVRFMEGDTIVRQFTVGNYKTGAKTFTGIPAGANYKVQVRSYKKVDGVGAFYSAWSTPKYVSL